ncbi:putative PDZ/DHR/GLGF domain protein [Burkholderia sp. 8Y]|uniref:PDZ domain-containing protein n=1 Tax=Burkholderia sp. 8Y TaxID=2653133 RepID=UPI0012F43426|nr:PDZ domain-containing protein [Burkholderia sp. 8Y]VXC84959.1 putative PDZ/DHR/GLGF domain protein [Burkholderia sp. 8Y]
MKRLLAIGALASLAGCANGFSQYYHGMTREEIVARSGPRSDSTPKVLYSSNVRSESERLAENNFALVGESSFQAQQTRRAEANAIEQGKTIGADVIVLSVRDAGSETVSMPLTMPTTSTSVSTFNGSAFGSRGVTSVMGSATTTSYGTATTFVPVTVRRADYYAGYWVKAKTPVMGIHIVPLSPEEHKKIGTNAGALINTVVIGSPAYIADIFKGDYLMAIGDVSISSGADLQRAIAKYAGAAVPVQLVRDGQRLTKNVAMATP